jgi:aconitate hydratase
MASFDKKSVVKKLKVGSSNFTIYSLPQFAKSQKIDISKLPFSIRILLESALRNFDDYQVTHKDIQTIVNWKPNAKKDEIAKTRIHGNQPCLRP